MKLRIKFVSNSSSSSFIINKKNLSELQIVQIWNHIEVARVFVDKLTKNTFHFGIIDNIDAWEIEETEKVLRGSTFMDNFEMANFLKMIGVKDENVEWDC